MDRRRSARVSLNIPFTPGAGPSNRRRESDFTLFRTPAAQRTRLEHDEDITFAGPSTLDENESLEVFRGGEWQVHRMTQLMNFSYSIKCFKRYSRILTQQLVTSSKDEHYKAIFSLLTKIGRNEKDNQAVKIEIIDLRLDTPRVVYEGIALSSRTCDVPPVEGCVHLPVLLARGAAEIQENVHRMLSTMFSCSIHKFEFPVEELLWMVASWSGSLTETKHMKTATFVFQLPRGDITTSWAVSMLKEIWENVKESDEPKINEDEVKLFCTALFTHMKQCLGMALSGVPLASFKTPNFELYARGKLRFKDTSFVPRILSTLTDMCEFRLRAVYNEEYD